MKKLSSGSLQNYCRTCLRQFVQPQCRLDKFNVHLIQDLSQWLVLCTSLPVSKKDYFPKYICQHCYNQLQQFNDFRNNAIRAIRLLTAAIAKDNAENSPKPLATSDNKTTAAKKSKCQQKAATISDACTSVNQAALLHATEMFLHKARSIQKTKCTNSSRELEMIKPVSCNIATLLENNEQYSNTCLRLQNENENMKQNFQQTFSNEETGKHQSDQLLIVDLETTKDDYSSPPKRQKDNCLALCKMQCSTSDLESVSDTECNFHPQQTTHNSEQASRSMISNTAGPTLQHALHNYMMSKLSVMRESLQFKSNFVNSGSISPANDSKLALQQKSSLKSLPRNCGTTYRHWQELQPSIEDIPDEELTANCDSTKQPKKRKSKFQCNSCKHRCISQKNLEAHQRTVHPETYAEKNLPFKCKYCQCAFSKSYRLRLHALEKHSAERNKYVCNFERCGKVFYSEFKYQQHYSAKHGSQQEQKSYICKECGLTLKNATAFRVHACKVSSNNNYHYTLQKYKDHIMQHTPDKHLHSHLTVDNIATDNKRRRHSNAAHIQLEKVQHRHQAIRRYRCHYCTDFFETADLLKKHELSHSGAKLYSCQICNKRFTQGISLHTHLKTHAVLRKKTTAGQSANFEWNKS